MGFSFAAAAQKPNSLCKISVRGVCPTAAALQVPVTGTQLNKRDAGGCSVQHHDYSLPEVLDVR